MSKSTYKLLTLLLVVVLSLGLVATAAAQGDEDPVEETLPVAIEITGTVEAVEDGTLTLDGITYLLGEEADPAAFVVGDNVSVVVLLGEDNTMTVVGLAEPADDPAAEPEPVYLEAHPVGTAIATALDVPYADVMGWYEVEIGFGEIARAYAVALATGADVTEVLAQRIDLGLGWGEIIISYDLHPADFTPNTVIGQIYYAGSDTPDAICDGLRDGSGTCADGPIQQQQQDQQQDQAQQQSQEPVQQQGSANQNGNNGANNNNNANVNNGGGSSNAGGNSQSGGNRGG